jgi:signal transduction histidine kinase
MISIEQLAAVIVGAVGALLFWANPRRKVNRAVFASSASVAAWLGCSHMTGAHPGDGLFWLRWVFAAGAVIPFGLWLVKDSIVGASEFRNPTWLGHNLFWFIGTGILFFIPFTGFFIPAHSTSDNRIFGLGYKLYHIGVILMYSRLLWDSLLIMKHLSGARKLELQVWLLGGCLAAILIYAFIAISGITGVHDFRKLKPVIVLIFYAGTAYAITSNRIFDARQIILVGIEKLTLVLIAIGVALLASGIAGAIFSGTSTLVISTVVVVIVASWLNNWLDQKFQFIPQSGTARQQAFATAQRETRLETLESSYLSLLKGWGQTEKALILSGAKGTLSGSGIELDRDGVIVRAMQSLRWATPERLARERQTHERQQITHLLNTHELGVLVYEQGPTLSLLVGVGVGTARRPFTYPQVNQLMELASIIQAAFERAHFSAKAQQAEQLATVGLLGASVAHEIRNPLVSIKTFVQLLPAHYNDENFRNKFFRLIGDEVSRIDQLTVQLLDLASPRMYSAQVIELHPLLKSGVDLVAAKAAHRQVDLITEFAAEPDRAFTDASAAKQVMLNLCFNAIQAVENHNSDKRWVKIATRNTTSGIEMTVADSGPGIAPEIRPRLFQPFQTTKSSGFGLGLAICSDILANLQASISVDPHEPGRGATFRVVFPCQPSSS